MSAHRLMFALWASLALGQVALADSIGAPRELPPKGYTQLQYVDSRGCAYLRAGFGDDVRWVPRVGPDKAAMCNQTPTLKSARAAMADLDAATTADASTAALAAQPGPPLDAMAPDRRAARTAPRPTTPQTAAAQSAEVKAVAPDATTGPVRTIACAAETPFLQRVPLADGGTTLVCSTAQGQLSGLRPPILSHGTPGQGLSPAPAPASAPSAKPLPARRMPVPELMVPEGYVAAWKDDRLNPRRGIGTETGQAQQDGLWTRRTPARLVPARRQAAARQPDPIAASPALADPQSVSPAPVPQASEAATGGTYFVQVGAFGLAANAQGASTRLAAAGLPVSLRDGNGLQLVLAGPFASRAAAQEALRLAQSAGFPEAFLR